MKQQDVLKSIGLHTEARSLIQTSDDQTAKIIEKGLVEDQSGRVGLRGNAWDTLQGHLTENHSVTKSLTKMGVKKAFGDENLKHTHGEEFHSDNDKQVEKLQSTAEEVDSVHPIDEQENKKVREGKKKRSGDYQEDREERETPRKAPVGSIKRSLSQDELFAKAMGELVPEPKAVKKGPLVKWAKEEEKEEAHKSFTIEKSTLFPKKAEAIAMEIYKPSADSIASGLMSQFNWKIKELQELKNSSWFMNSELDDAAKEMAEKMYAKLKREINALVEKYNKIGKSFGMMDEQVDVLKKSCGVYDKYFKKGETIQKSAPLTALDDLVGVIKGEDSLVEMLPDSNDPDVIANIHENSVELAEQQNPEPVYKSKVPFLKSAGPGGFIFDFGNKTGNPLADNATALLNRHADGTQAAIAQDQRQTYDRALTQYVKKGDAAFAGGEFGSVNNEWANQMSKPLDQQVREAHEAGAFEKSTGPAVKNQFNKVEANIGGQVVKATSPTDAAVLEMFKAEMEAMNEPGMVVADIRNGGRQSVVVDASTGSIE